MDQLEQKIRDAFEAIPFGDSNILDQDIVYSLVIDGKRADLILMISKDDESFISSTAKAIEEALKGLDEIEEVGIKVVENENQAQAQAEHADLRREQQQKKAPNTSDCGDGGCGSGGGSSCGHAAPPKKVSYLGDYENVILVASGKGGVGKSTTAVNLAMALKAMGKSVSILDADIYGPSLPVMMGARGEFPEVVQNRINPMSRYGVEFMSIGNLVDEDESMIWRGPMVHQVLEQMLRDTTWPGGDYMIIDLPPGTGDVQITLAQLTEADGAVVVCTPQDVALLDARKAINMFKKVDIPILGMIENMSFFKCPSCGDETAIFSTGGTQGEAKQQETDFLGRIPIELAIRLGGDQGNPVVNAYPESATAQTYKEIATKLDKILED